MASRSSGVRCASAVLGVLTASAALAIDNTWIGASGTYGTAANWNLSVVACNQFAANSDPVVPFGTDTITQNVTTCGVDSLSLGAGNSLTLSPGTTYQADNATIEGNVRGLGGDFSAVNATFFGPFASASASDGSTVSIPALQHSSIGFPNNNVAFFFASGATSTLDLSSLGTLDGSFDSASAGTQVHSVQALSGGFVDLRALSTVTGPVDPEDSYDFFATGGGNIDLSSLATTTTTGGQVRILAGSGSSLFLPSLTDTLNTIIFAFPGGTIDATGGPWTYETTRLGDLPITVMGADGPGAVVDLNMTSILMGSGDTGSGLQVQGISASNGGYASYGFAALWEATEKLEARLSCSSGGQVDMPALAETRGSGRVRFSAGAGCDLSFPSLQTGDNAIFAANSGGTITAESFAAINIPDWSPELFGSEYQVIDSRNPGSSVDLSQVAHLDCGFDSPNGEVQTAAITAADGAIVDLGITSAITPRDPEDLCFFDIIDQGLLRLENLETVSATSVGNSGFLVLGAFNSDLVVPNLQFAENVAFLAVDGSIAGPGSPWTATYGFDDPGVDDLAIAFASGSGTEIDFGPATIDAGFDSDSSAAQSLIFEAVDGAFLDMSQVPAITGPVDPEDRVRVIARSGSSIDLSSVNELQSGVTVEAFDASVFFDEITLSNGVTLSVSGPSASVEFRGDFVLGLGSQASLEDNADAAFYGDFRNEITDEIDADFQALVARWVAGDLRGTQIVPQFMEVAGTDLGDLGGVPPSEPDNFQIGRLEVGAPGAPVELHLRDESDNGNGFSPCSSAGEALYLPGLPGEDGLGIAQGSTLVLDGVPLYATISGVLTHINPLVPPDGPLSFGLGFIERGAGQDVDEDGVIDLDDNCRLVANANQRDTDGDGFGNACDADLNNDNIVNVIDLGLLKSVFFTADPDADFNGDGVVNVIDLGLQKGQFFEPPGPSCVVVP